MGSQCIEVEWVDASERTPKVLTKCIVSVEFYEPWSGHKYRESFCAVWDPDHILECYSGPFRFGGWGFDEDFLEGQEIRVTHWMPFPKLPGGETR